MKFTKKELINLYEYYLNDDIRSAFDEPMETSCIQATGVYYNTSREMMEATMGKIRKFIKRKKRKKIK
jgi:hypothetical protein